MKMVHVCKRDDAERAARNLTTRKGMTFPCVSHLQGNVFFSSCV